jgi:hypothetical protein
VPGPFESKLEFDVERFLDLLLTLSSIARLNVTVFPFDLDTDLDLLFDIVFLPCDLDRDLDADLDCDLRTML